MKNQIMGISKQTGKWSQSGSLKQSKRIWTRIGSGIMLLVLIGAIALPVRAAETPIFEDTPVEAWYYQTVKTLVQDQRQRAPFGLDGETRQEQDSSPLSDFFGLEKFAAKKLSSGRECIIDGDGSTNDRQKMDYGLYLLDNNIQCSLDNVNDCKY